jgi:hypothetical protein
VGNSKQRITRYIAWDLALRYALFALWARLPGMFRISFHSFDWLL